MRADYGFDLADHGDSKRIFIRPVRNPDRVSAFVALSGALAILVFLSAILSDLGVTALLIVALVLAVTAAFDLNGRPCNIVMGMTTMVLRRETFDRGDVLNVSVVGPVEFSQRLFLGGPAAVATGVKRAASRTDHAVTFDYGSRRVIVVSELSEPQATAIARVLADWAESGLAASSAPSLTTSAASGAVLALS